MDPEVGTENGDEMAMETSGKGPCFDAGANPYPLLDDYAREQPDGTEHLVEVIHMDADDWWMERWHMCFWTGETYTRTWQVDRGYFWNIYRPRCGGHGGHTEHTRCSGSF